MTYALLSCFSVRFRVYDHRLESQHRGAFMYTAESHPGDGGVGYWEEQRDESGFALHTAWMPDLLGGSQVHRLTKENTKTGSQITD